jgi:hypothetical protein
MAYGSPFLLFALLYLTQPSSLTSIASREPADPKILRSNSRPHAYLVVGLLSVACLGFGQMHRKQLSLWADDYPNLMNCITIDRKDWECFQFLGDYFGYDASKSAQQASLQTCLTSLSSPSDRQERAVLSILQPAGDRDPQH